MGIYSSPALSNMFDGDGESPQFSPDLGITSPGTEYSALAASPSYSMGTAGVNMGYGQGADGYDAKSPSYSMNGSGYFNSPSYSPVSPAYSPVSPAYSPTSPA